MEFFYINKKVIEDLGCKGYHYNEHVGFERHFKHKESINKISFHEILKSDTQKNFLSETSPEQWSVWLMVTEEWP
jgi:hypothetical protein